MTHYLGHYILTHGYALMPAPWYIAWSFGTGMLREMAELQQAKRERDGWWG